MKVMPKITFLWMLLLIAALGLSSFLWTNISNEDLWMKAEQNGEQARQAFLRCRDYVRGWLAHADPKSGLIPRNLTRDSFWNAQDAAADNYPFMVLTAAILDRALFEGKMKEMLEAEKRLTSRVGPLPDDFVFETQSFRHNEVDMTGRDIPLLFRLQPSTDEVQISFHEGSRSLAKTGPNRSL